MTNVFKLPVAHPRPLAFDCAESVDRSAPVGDLIAQTRGVLLRALLLLDVAAQQGRRLARLIDDPAKKAAMNADVDLVETALDVARVKALEI